MGKTDLRALRAFRSAVAKLKRSGLVDKSIDARSVQPSRKLKSAIRNYADVLAGAKVIPLSRLKVDPAELKARNYQVVKVKGGTPSVIVPHFKDETVKAKKGLIEFSSPDGIRRLELPQYKGTGLRRYFADINRAYKETPPKGVRYGARFYTSRTKLYRSMSDLINKVAGYQTTRRADNSRDQLDVVRNFEIVSVPDARSWNRTKKKKR